MARLLAILFVSVLGWLPTARAAVFEGPLPFGLSLQIGSFDSAKCELRIVGENKSTLFSEELPAPPADCKPGLNQLSAYNVGRVTAALKEKGLFTFSPTFLKFEGRIYVAQFVNGTPLKVLSFAKHRYERGPMVPQLLATRENPEMVMVQAEGSFDNSQRFSVVDLASMKVVAESPQINCGMGGKSELMNKRDHLGYFNAVEPLLPLKIKTPASQCVPQEGDDSEDCMVMPDIVFDYDQTAGRFSTVKRGICGVNE